MYDELIDWLRELAKLTSHCELEDCDKCEAADVCSQFTNENIIQMATQAADVIEELSKQLEQKKKKEPYQRKRKKCCCGAARVYLYHFDGGYYLKCHGCGKRTPVMYDKNELDAVWNEIAECPVEYKETSDIPAEKENEE